MGGSCARVCPTEELCERACVHTAQEHKPIQIGALQRHATDWLMEKRIGTVQTRGGDRTQDRGGRRGTGRVWPARTAWRGLVMMSRYSTAGRNPAA